MTDVNLLKSIIKDSGLKLSYLAETVLELTPYGFSKKLNGVNEFKQSEIMKLCAELKIDNETRDRIFFTNER